MYTIHWKTALSVVCLCVTATFAHAQPSISLSGTGIYKSGPDYASDVLQDPWDFSNHEDISPDPDEFSNPTLPDHADGWAEPSATAVDTYGTGPAFLSGGWFRGTAAGDARLSLLHRTYVNTLKPGRTGERFPIDPTKYRKMAVKMRIPHANAQTNLVAYWWHALILEPNYTSRGGAASLSPSVPAGASAQIYVLDLAQASTIGPHASYTTAAVKSLWIDPVANGTGEQIQIDWVRLTAGDNDPNASMIPVQIGNCGGFQYLTVTDGEGFTARIDSAGGPPSAFNAGIFPAGDYRVSATCNNGSSAAAPFTINAPPQVIVLDPDEKGNPATDWATMNGDPWDFEQPTDVDRLSNVTVTQGPCATGGCGLIPAAASFPGRPGHMLRASSWGNVGDPGLGIVDGLLTPINTLKHRLLTFSLKINREYNLGLGSMARVFWGSEATSGQATTTSKDMLVFPGVHTYTIDLATLTPPNELEPGCPGCRLWSERAIRHFRIDPHEFGDTPTVFDIDDVTLTEPDSMVMGQAYAVRFAFADDTSTGSTYTARIQAHPWPSRPLSAGVQLGSIPGLAPGAHTFNILGLPEGAYTISVDVVETQGGVTQTSRAFSTGMLEVTNPGASAPKLTVTFPQPNQGTGAPFTIQGCAYDDGRPTGGIGMDDLSIIMRAIGGPRAGMVLPLGFDPVVPHTGVLQYGPLNTTIPCPSGTGPYANAGFRVVGVGAGTPASYLDGPWVLDVRGRSTISGETVVLPEIPFFIGPVPPPAPVNFTANATGNTVFVSWQAPPGGAASYQIQLSHRPGFEALLYSLNVPQAGQYNGVLPSGTYYIRVYARAPNGTWSSPSPALRVDVALPTPPGAPALVATQVSSNPVTLNWSPGPGGSPAVYTIHAGTQPGASDLLVASMGLATGVTAAAPVGAPIYVRVVASNGAGAAVSNEITIHLTPPGPPTLQPADVNGHTVTLNWSPPAGSAPASYTVLARFPGQPTIIARMTVAGTSIGVPNVPPGNYQVTVVSNSPLGTSTESNSIPVSVSP